MNRRFVASLLAIACSIAIPVAAQAAVYTFKVPVALTNVGAPAGTVFQVACFVFTGDTPGDPQSTGDYAGRMGWANLPPLKSDGSTSANVTISITTTSTTPAMKSYKCGLGDYSEAMQMQLQLNQTSNTSNGGIISNYVSGKLP